MARCCGTRLVYRYEPPAQAGLNYRWWTAAAGPHLDPLEWDGPADSNGFPLPTAANPDFQGVSTLGDIRDSNSGAGAARYGVIDGWVWLPDDVTDWRDGNTNTGELGMVLSAPCCGSVLVEQPGGNHDTSTVTADRTLMDATPVTGGWHYIYNPQSDASAFQGLDLEYSTNGGASWQDIAVTQPDPPSIEILEIKNCEPVPDGWQLEPLSACCPPRYVPQSDGLDEDDVTALLPQPATTAPIPDNETDTAIRTGQVGTSALYARADHNHPIRRQANPGDITLTAGGSAVVTQATIILDRWSTEETYEFNTRTRVSQVAGTSWGWLTVPAIAGFQQPQIAYLGTYRSDSQSPQIDSDTGAGDDGAAPRGPLMSSEAHHWSSTNRLYFAYLRRDEAITSMFIEAVVRYIRV